MIIQHAIPGDSAALIARYRQTLSQEGWNVAKTARLLGVSRPTVYRKMVAAGLNRPV